MLAGIIKPDVPSIEMPKWEVSYKPQTIAPKFYGTVKDLLHYKLNIAWEDPLFKTMVSSPLDIDSIINCDVQDLSGGEI
jgi:ATP-binding cassette subfamily E protein 1